MSFTGREDHSISLATAAAWTANYRAAEPGAVLGHFYGKDAITAILAQANCVGIRIYHAIDDKGAKQLVIVGVKANENDIYTGLLAERGLVCPPMCGGGNALNGF